ncbi:MAG: LamG domain-containing protein [Armatimonadetes bacterium]|nr:LamG domain-containing protein [Armatimonadota bacterium]
MRLLCTLGLLLLATAAFAAEGGLVAHWTFNEGQGTVARDSSGNGNDGQVRNAKWVKNVGGACLEFDGQTSVVDCGNSPSLDVTDRLTLEAWVFPTAAARAEPGILGKQFDRFLLTYYTDGQCYFYIGAGGNNAQAPISVGVWQLITATFDGKMQHLYLNGRLMNSHLSRFPAAPKGGNFTIGCVAGNASADDPNYRNTAHFEGMIDEVRVYNRPLSADEIMAHARAELPAFEISEDYAPAKPVATVKSGGLTVRAAVTGQLQLATGGDAYVINSAFSYPGERLGWNTLAGKVEGQAGWRPIVRKLSSGALQVVAQAPAYRLQREVVLRNGAIEIVDEITNTSTEDLGLLSRHDLICSKRLAESYSPGGGETPFIYLQAPGSTLGLTMEDNLSRVRFEPRASVRVNSCSYRLGNMILSPGKTLTFRSAIIVLPARSDYFDLVNALRRRWHTDYTIQGPLSWIDVEDGMLSQPERLKAYLQRKQVKVMLLSPWLDYDPGRWDHVWPREEYRQKAMKAAAQLKAVQPDIKCLGCIETDWVTICPEKIPGGDKLPVHGKGSGGLSREQTEIIKRSGIPFVDSMKLGADGTGHLELYSRGGKPQTALSVYPAVGNYQYEFLMGQVKFLIDDCGLDGFYIDEFSQGWSSSIRNHGQWDGLSGDVDPLTGRIRSRWTDCSLAGVQARVNLVNYALDRGKTVVANTFATAMEERSLPVNRFSETWGQFDPMVTPTGEKPTGLNGLFRSNLGSMIGLGILGHPDKHDTAQRLMKALVTYLRHGMVYYHYFLEDIPQEGPGSGEYGPVNHSFPITPVELGEGFIRGRERIIACVSGTYRWEQSRRPRVLCFDMDGRPTSTTPTLKQDGKTWLVTLKLQDWAQIAVVE